MGDLFLLFLIVIVFLYTFWDDVFTDTNQFYCKNTLELILL